MNSANKCKKMMLYNNWTAIDCDPIVTYVTVCLNFKEFDVNPSRSTAID